MCTSMWTRPGSIQARGDNLISILKAFTNSSKLQSARERVSLGAAVNGSNPDDERPVYFDYLSWFLVCWNLLLLQFYNLVCKHYSSHNKSLALKKCFIYTSFRYSTQEGKQWFFIVFLLPSSFLCLFCCASQLVDFSVHLWPSLTSWKVTSTACNCHFVVKLFVKLDYHSRSILFV